jgi:hypothetical protein
MGLTEIKKQTITSRNGISIRAIAAEVGVDKHTVLLTKQKIKPITYLTFIKKTMFTQLKFLIFGSVLSSVYEFFFLASDGTLCIAVEAKGVTTPRLRNN